LIINTNGTIESITVPFSVLAIDRKERARKVAGLAVMFGLLLAPIYLLGLVDQISMMLVNDSPLRVSGNWISINDFSDVFFQISYPS